MHLFNTNTIVRILIKKRLKSTIYFYSSYGMVAKSNERKMKNQILQRIDNITKSSEDKRLYRGLILSNYMKVLLVSDPLTDKSAAALDVNVGYMNDPDGIQGLAHFVEHMLFLGTKKYPSENDYNRFLSEHGGGSNAATYPDHTNYFFDIVPEHLSGALDRFAQFFLHPLFTESMTERELNAIHSEHDKNIALDDWRLDQLDKHIANPKHAYHKFGTGNKETLDLIPKSLDINIRNELLKFHSTWYSSNIMCLTVLGKESLDELENMIVDLFSQVENKNVTPSVWQEHPFTSEQLQSCVYMVPVKDIRNLNIVFPSPDLQNHYKSSPNGYISNLVGHEGPGSLLSILKERGWSNHLMAGYKSPFRGTGFFGISVDLTEEGMLHVDDIITLSFQYLNMLKKEGPILTIHEELRDIQAMIFRFKDKETPRGYISSIVHNLQEYPFEDILCNNYLLTEWKPEMITELLDSFTPDNVRIEVIAKKFTTDVNMKEPWYGTEYKLEKIVEDKLMSWKNAGFCSDLKLPEPNKFIPENFDLYQLDADATDFPTIIKDTAITRVWFKQDDKFLLPKANLMFDFVSPLAYLDPINCNLTHMFTQLFKDSLNQYAYAAELAGLRWDISNTKYGLTLGVSGFNDKQHVLLEKIMENLTDFKVNPNRFEIFKENYIRTLKNFSAEQPYQHAVYYLAVLLTEQSWTKDELLAATSQLTVDRLEAFIPQILSKTHIECMLHGNLNQKHALKLVDIVENKLSSSFNMSPLLPRQLLLNRELKLEDGCDYVYEVGNSVHKSSCVELYFQCGLQSTESNILLELFAQIIHEPCFNTLRTKEQLGYIVFSGLRKASGIQGLRIIVQSDRHPLFLDQRIEYFLKNMLDYLQNMSDEDFSKHKESLAAQKLEKPKQLVTQSQLYWMEISNQQYHFDRANVEVAYLRTLNKEDIIEFYKKLIEENAHARHKVAVHVVSMSEGGAGHMNGETLDSELNNSVPSLSKSQPIQDVTVFKSAHGMHSLVQPYINITRKGNKCKL